MSRRDVAELRAEYEQLVTEYERSRQRLATLHERMSALTSSATSDDGLVTVTVGARGELSTVEVEPRAYRRLAPTELGESIVATARKAGEQVAEQLRELLSPLMPAGVPVEKLLAPGADWSAYLRRDKGA
ncbi:YbaB/EbfC family nucleoid-associated protein [Micromonosporaceae bacterium B7E4]